MVLQFIRTFSIFPWQIQPVLGWLGSFHLNILFEMCEYFDIISHSSYILDPWPPPARTVQQHSSGFWNILTGTTSGWGPVGTKLLRMLWKSFQFYLNYCPITEHFTIPNTFWKEVVVNLSKYSMDCRWPRRPWPNAGRKKQKKRPKNHLFFLKK